MTSQYQQPPLYQQPATLPPSTIPATTARPQQPPPHQFTDPTHGGYAPARPATRSMLPVILTSLLPMLLSIPFIVTGIWLAARHHAHCLRFLEWPFIILGLILLLVPLIGLLGAATRNAFLLYLYMFLLFLTILLLLVFTIFAFVVIRGSKGHHVSGANFKEYRLDDYSGWMQNKVNSNWGRIRDCVVRDGVCGRMNNKYLNVNDLYRSKLSYVESGCCKPPSSCCFSFVNPTTWVNPVSPGNDVDCSRWSNDPNRLCYDCSTCRAAVIRNLKKDWGKAAKVAIAFLVLLMLLYILALLSVLRALAHRPTHTTTGAPTYTTTTGAPTYTTTGGAGGRY